MVNRWEIVAMVNSDGFKWEGDGSDLDFWLFIEKKNQFFLFETNLHN